MFELFISENCPYCKKVMKFMQENNIDYIQKNISDFKNYELLMELGEKHQVPFLNDPDNNVKMYESDDIIKYVSERK